MGRSTSRRGKNRREPCPQTTSASGGRHASTLPDPERACEALAAIAAQNGDSVNARSLYEQAVNLNPDDKVARSGLTQLGAG